MVDSGKDEAGAMGALHYPVMRCESVGDEPWRWWIQEPIYQRQATTEEARLLAGMFPVKRRDDPV